MSEWEAVCAKFDLERDAAVATAMLLEEDGSAKADAYLASVDYSARLTAWKASR
jgi:hypothetical protein